MVGVGAVVVILAMNHVSHVDPIGWCWRGVETWLMGGDAVDYDGSVAVGEGGRRVPNDLGTRMDRNRDFDCDAVVNSCSLCGAHCRY